MKPTSEFEKAAASGDFDLLIQILERAQAKFERQNRCLVKALMRRMNKLVGLWLGDES